MVAYDEYGLLCKGYRTVNKMEPLGQTVKAWQILYKGELMINKASFIWLTVENDILIHHTILHDIMMYLYTNSYYSVYLKNIVIYSKRANQLNQEVNTFTLAEVEIWKCFPDIYISIYYSPNLEIRKNLWKVPDHRFAIFPFIIVETSANMFIGFS